MAKLNIPVEAILYLPTERFGLGDFTVPTTLLDGTFIYQVLKTQNKNELEFFLTGCHHNVFKNYTRERLDKLVNSNKNTDKKDLMDFYDKVSMFYIAEHLLYGTEIPYMGSGILTVNK
jgi:CMP-N-acetylneuraminic acid synthetase